MRQSTIVTINTKALGYAAACVFAAIVFAAAKFLLVPTRVGDGTEYYAMYLAWINDHRPFITEHTWAAVRSLYDSHVIRNFVPAQQLYAQFPELRLGSTADFNHFWMYSLFAASVHAVVARLGHSLSPHSSFLLLHAILFALLLILAYRVHGWRGLVTAALLTILSPMVWYVDKVHTEFFTYCFCSAAVIAFCQRRYFLSSLCLAVASTQNISFAAVAIAPLLVSLLDRDRESALRFNLIQVIVAAVILLLVLIHPGYYFFRYGAIDPQLVAGGATIGGNARNFYVWLVDPDIGLLPNCPLGAFLLLVMVVMVVMRRTSQCASLAITQAIARRRAYLFFCAVYLAVNLYAQSSTDNLNSGATSGVARYATWYIPLFYPALFAFVACLGSVQISRAARLCMAGLLALFLFACGNFTYTYQRPELSEAGSMKPSPASLLLQTNWPQLYDPPAEVFSERYSGIGESPALRSARAVIGPDCKKILITGATGRVYSQGCGYDEKRVIALLDSNSIAHTAKGAYIHLTDAQADSLFVACPAVLNASRSGNATDSMFTGFSAAEPWGRWSEGTTASIICLSSGAATAKIMANGFVPAGHTQRLIVSANGGAKEQFFLDETAKLITVPLGTSPNKLVKLRFWFPDAVSPADLHLSEDGRQLAMGLRSVAFRN